MQRVEALKVIIVNLMFKSNKMDLLILKPLSLCLVQMGEKGLELVKSYPDVLPRDIQNEIIIKSMPLGAKDGDFTSTILSDNNAISGYVFSIPIQNSRDNIASIVAVFDDTNYNTNNIRKLFSILVTELKKQNSFSTNILMEILPTLYRSFDTKNMKIKISSIVTVEIDFSDDSSKENKPANAAKSLTEDMWK
ncbi:MAG: hypothetical protein ACFFDW_11085 [Candidatus Thorarchaeota archaeon]